MAICRRYDAPLLPRGGGTSLAGECCNAAVVIDFSKYLNRVLAIDPERRLARVEPGCILDHLRAEAAKHGLTFGPDPATHDHNTLGGMIGNNSGGVHAVMNGITVHNVQALEVLTYDGARLTVGPTSEDEFRAILRAGGRRGEIYRRLDELRRRYEPLIRARFPHIPRRVSGYENLDQLFPENGMNVARALVGTEGTCVTVLEATLNLIHNPAERVIAIIGFPDIFQAADAVPRVLEHKPIGLEGFDQTMIDRYKVKGLHADDLKVLPEGEGWLLVEFGADTEEEAAQKAQGLVDAFKGDGPAHLAAIAVGDPVIRAVTAKEGFHHRLGAVLVGDEDGAVGVMEHPQPPVRLADPEAGLVRGQRRACQQPRLDQARLRRKGLATRIEDVDQRALADGEPEQVRQHRAQPRQRKALDRAQIDDKGAQVRPERRSRLQSRRRLGLEAFGAAGAHAAMQRHPRDVRRDPGDFDAVVFLADDLRHAGHVGATTLAGRRQHRALRGWVGVQRTMRTPMRLGLRLGR